MSPRRTWRSVILVVLLTAVVACVGGGVDEGNEAPEGAERIAYADHGDAFGDLWLPPQIDSDRDSPVPVAVLIHGGFWRDGFSLELMDPLVPSLLEAGFAVWNIEYRRVGAGGGYPTTFLDVAAALDHLQKIRADTAPALDLSDVVTIGHSAGGQLAVWLASRPLLPAGSPGAGPVVEPRLAVSLAGVLDLVGCVAQGVGGSACSDVVGASPIEEPARYAQTSPTAMLPIDAAVVAVHGEADQIVPIAQSATYVDRALASGSTADLQVVSGADHFDVIDPAHGSWALVLARIED